MRRKRAGPRAIVANTDGGRLGAVAAAVVRIEAGRIAAAPAVAVR